MHYSVGMTIGPSMIPANLFPIYKDTHFNIGQTMWGNGGNAEALRVTQSFPEHRMGQTTCWNPIWMHWFVVRTRVRELVSHLETAPPRGT